VFLILTRDRCSLALTLANAVLHFHDTPWLAERWDISDVSMLSDIRGSSPGDLPYVSKRFACSSTTVRKAQFFAVKNATTFALGVALLEISYGNCLETFATPEDLDANGSSMLYTDYSIANRLVEGIHKRELPNYANATRRCIHCTFDSSVYNLNDDNFRERFYQGVVVPLQQDYDYSVGNA
jgi:hypothetical protein